jgi:hypothetical protein
MRTVNQFFQVAMVVSSFLVVVGFVLPVVPMVFVGVPILVISMPLYLGTRTPSQLMAEAEKPLRDATLNWSLPLVARTYDDTARGRQKLGGEAAILSWHGYYLAGQSGYGGHINFGRTVAPALLTGGASLLFGASRSRGRTTVTFYRQ